MKEKVLLGMSGGVDSSVSAVLLKNQGYEVIGATMILCENNSEKSIEDAKKVCEKLNIKHITLDFRKEFKENVIGNFIECYECGRTPNPCIECNRYLKFGKLFEKAMELGCDYIATGHYAKVEWNDKFNQNVLRKSKADGKDQSYFLYKIKKEVLQKMIFPLANYKSKEEIRQIAEENNLLVARKKDSQEICFIPNDDYITFLEKCNQNECEKQEKEGNIVLKDGTVLGEHNGITNYTIGQRKGLGIAYKSPLYVLKIDKQNNSVVVGEERDLYSKELEAENVNLLINNIDLSKPINVMAKIRYRSKVAKAVVKFIENENGTLNANVIFEEEQKSITPGQSVVFYIDDDIVLGGGIIK